METVIIGLPGVDFFVHRAIKNDIVLGAKIYDYIINLLEIVGKEVTYFDSRKESIQLFWYREQNNGSMPNRYFEVSYVLGQFIEREFRDILLSEIEFYGLRNQSIGKNILFQLNNGQISAIDFEKQL